MSPFGFGTVFCRKNRILFAIIGNTQHDCLCSAAYNACGSGEVVEASSCTRWVLPAVHGAPSPKRTLREHGLRHSVTTPGVQPQGLERSPRRLFTDLKLAQTPKQSHSTMQAPPEPICDVQHRGLNTPARPPFSTGRMVRRS